MYLHTCGFWEVWTGLNCTSSDKTENKWTRYKNKTHSSQTTMVYLMLFIHVTNLCKLRVFLYIR